MVDWTEAASKGLHPAQVAGLGYLAYTLLGWLLLCLPFAQKLPEGIPAIDNLFIATSAVSTTGLVTVSVVDSYNAFGQVVVLMLIQLGGLGYMTFGSFVILSTKGGLSAERSRVGRTVFSLPESFRIDKFIRSVVVFTVVIEAAGALALYAVFRRADAATPLWSAVFHSVSAFCTAGFSLYDTSFEAFAGDFWLNLVISALSYCGAIGFIVWVDYWRKLTGKVQQVTLTSRIILWMSLWLTVVSTFMIFVGEPSLDAKPVEDKLLESFFQAMTAMTTVGFNTIPTASLSSATLLVIIALMIIGASPSGTGGGVKSTTVSALIGVMRSTLRGDAEVRFRKKVVPRARVWTATANMGFYMLMLLVGTYLLELTQRAGFVENIFEAASALGTVGLSMGITASLSGLGKLVVILLMFCGRLGPLTFGMALFFKSHKGSEASDNDLAV
jgi:trk system potassium uptake protein TrkH